MKKETQETTEAMMTRWAARAWDAIIRGGTPELKSAMFGLYCEARDLGYQSGLNDAQKRARMKKQRGRS